MSSLSLAIKYLRCNQAGHLAAQQSDHPQLISFLIITSPFFQVSGDVTVVKKKGLLHDLLTTNNGYYNNHSLTNAFLVSQI